MEIIEGICSAFEGVGLVISGALEILSSKWGMVIALITFSALSIFSYFKPPLQEVHLIKKLPLETRVEAGVERWKRKIMFRK